MSLASRLMELAEDSWGSVFASRASTERAVEHLIATASTMGRRTISRAVTALGRSDQDWSADYKLFSRSRWDARELYVPVMEQGLKLIGNGPIPIALDDTKLSKSGRNVPGAGWHRDPMSPPFHVNLRWGVRYLQASLLVRQACDGPEAGCRSLPIRFEPAPWIRKPGKRATEEDRKAYRKAQKEHNLSRSGRQMLVELRQSLDRLGGRGRVMIVAADGGFCNRALFGEALEGVRLLARTRKDARLCYPAKPGKRGLYDAELFTPQQVRLNSSIEWEDTAVFYAGAFRSIRYKQCPGVLWRRGSGTRPLRLIAIAPQPYTAPGGGQSYRDPAYLLTDDLESPVSLLMQIYFDRWQIEVNHREEKSFIGVGQAQLWSSLSAARHPTFQVASYSLILLASLLEFGAARTDSYTPLPKWRKSASRPSILDLLTRLRQDLCNEAQGSIPMAPLTTESLIRSAFT